jgi:hypothetical protein
VDSPDLLGKQEVTIGVLPIMAHAPAAKFSQQLNAVADWFFTISNHQCHLSFTLLPAISLARPISYFAVAGGMGRPPQNSQSLVRMALDQLKPDSLAKLAQMQGRLLVVVGGHIKPHTWHLLKGGKLLGQKVWCDRYAIIQSDAPLGTIAHELGHLLFNWPDLIWTKELAEECLMAQGASGIRSKHPSPPCGPLRVKMEWCDTFHLHPSDPVIELTSSKVGLFWWQQIEWLIEYRPDYRPRLLLYHSQNKNFEARPQLLERIFLEEEDLRKSVLGLVAPYLRQ